MASHLEMNFCRRCAAPLSPMDENGYTCTNGHKIFPNQAPSVGVFFVADDGTVLLSERGIEPSKGKLDSFGGFIDPSDESLEAAAERELQEELSLQSHEYEPLRYLTSQSAPYYFDAENMQVMTTLFWTRLTVDRVLQPSDDVAKVISLPLHSFDLNLLSSKDIVIGIEKLRTLFKEGSQNV